MDLHIKFWLREVTNSLDRISRLLTKQPPTNWNQQFCLLFVEKFRFSAEFIEMRRQGLDIFVNRIASHPELRQSDDLRLFLQADEEVSFLPLSQKYHNITAFTHS